MAKRTAAAVEKINDGMRCAAYDEAVSAMADVDVEQLQAADIPGVIAAMRELFLVTFATQTEDAVRACELWCAAAERGLAETAGDPEVEASLAQAMNAKGLSYERVGRVSDALSVVDALVSRFADSPAVAVRRHVVAGMANRARAFLSQGDSAAARTTLADIEARFGDDDAVAAQVRGATLVIRVLAGESSDDVIRLCDEFLRHHADDPSLGVQHTAAFALGHKASAFGATGRYEEAANVAQELISKFSEATRFNTRAVVAKGFVTKIAAHIALGDEASAEATMRELEQRFRSDRSEDTQRSLGEADQILTRMRSGKRAGKKQRKKS